MREPAASSLAVRDLAILCPTFYEANAIRRIAKLPRSMLIVTGPGSQGVQRAVSRVRDRVDRVLLAGLAGGLDASVSAGTAYAITRVLSTDGRRLDPPWVVRGLPTARLVTASAVVGSPPEKSLLGERTGASLVDLEGFAFADAASSERLRWGIIRAVSDAHDQTLPKGIDTLISPSGRTRYLRAIIWMLANRRQFADAPALIGQSWAGLELIGQALREALDDSGRLRR